MSVELHLDATSRVLFIAPHPDDDTLAAAGVLQRTVTRGGAVRVLFATRGENNPWTQRLVERRLRIDAAARRRFGERRRGEALAALARLGLEATHADFLGFPDQGLTALLKSGGEEPVARLAAAIASWRPGILIAPSLADLHPDHNALGILVTLAIDRIGSADRPAQVLRYVIHAVGARPVDPDGWHLSLTPGEQDTKRDALRCHATQLAVHPAKFMSFAGPREMFAADLPAAVGARPVHGTGPAAPDESSGSLSLALRPRARPGAFGRWHLALLAVSAGGERTACAVSIHRRTGRAEVLRAKDGARLATGTMARSGETISLSLAWGAGEPPARLFVKIERPFGFFDESGWSEVRVAPARPEGARDAIRAGDRSVVACVVPCYNVAAYCAEVVRGATAFSDQVLAVDDGSDDATPVRLREIEGTQPSGVRTLTFATNRGKGVALIEGIRNALQDPRVGVVVTLDGDGQHRPEDIPRLLAAWREGADLVIGARGLAGNIPLRSRVGNSLIRGFLRRLYPGCPADTQSGFRALDRAFASQVVSRVAGARYETETHMLLLAMDEGYPIATVPIPTIYSEGNRSSHFRPLADSTRIGLSVVRWKMSRGRATGSTEGEPSATTHAT